MIVSELIAELQKMPQDAEVVLENECGDGHGHVNSVGLNDKIVALGFCCENLEYRENW